MNITHQGNLTFYSFGNMAYDALDVHSSHMYKREIDEAASVEFNYGVASGDPLSDRVVIWTKLDVTMDEKVTVTYKLYTDEEMTQIAISSSTYTTSDVDFVVKVDAVGLQPFTFYWFEFESNGIKSIKGRTKTLPLEDADIDNLRIGVASCANMAYGYFNSYEALNESDPDFVVFLGDSIYEHPDKEYGDGSRFEPSRTPEPNKRLLTLEDYRKRHAQYHRDPQLQLALQNRPFIHIWDDHEISNNAYMNGSPTHEKDHGPFKNQLKAGMRAFFEHTAIRHPFDTESIRIYRSFKIGKLANLIMIDTRYIGRQKQEESPSEIKGSKRTMLGYEQEEWLKNEVLKSKERGSIWTILGNQVVMGQFDVGNSILRRVALADAWDDYPASRSRFYDVLEENDIQGLVVLTGDVHVSLASQLMRDPYRMSKLKRFSRKITNGFRRLFGQKQKQDEQILGIELVTPAIASFSIEDKTKAKLARSVLWTQPHIRHGEFHYKGFMIVEFNKERVKSTWFKVDTCDKIDYKVEISKVLEADRQDMSLK